ncbi:MAG: 50S ribosomal protein L19 [Chloroflexi bacterium]|nr:50S ribosomal protein L19 [Chloroflexota bacterium]
MDVNALVKLTPNANVQTVAPGDGVKVTIKVIEGEKTRSQVFQGVVIRVRHGKHDADFTVRRVTQGVGVERTFMVNSPLLEKVEVMRRSKVRRARLFYLRALSVRDARLKEKGRGVEEMIGAEAVEAIAPAEAVPPAEPVAASVEVQAEATAGAKAEAEPEKVAGASAEAKAEPSKTQTA